LSLRIEKTGLTAGHSFLGQVLVIMTLPLPRKVRQGDGPVLPISRMKDEYLLAEDEPKAPEY